MSKATHPIVGMLADVTIDAAAAEGGESKAKRFSVVAYTGGPMEVEGYDLPVVLNLDGMTFGKSIVANLDHDRTKRVGHVTETQVASGQLRLAGVASASTPHRDEVIASAAEGFVWQASVEAKPNKITKLGKDKTADVNGRTISGPLYVIEASTLRGFAFVSNGADDNTTVDIAATAANNRGKPEMNQQCRQWISATLKLDPDTLTAEQAAALEAQYEGQLQPSPSGPTRDALGNIVAGAKARYAREQKISDLAAKAIAENPREVDAIAALAEMAIKAEWDSDRFELQLYRDIVRPKAHTVEPKNRTGELTDRLVEAAVCITAKLPDIEKHFGEQELYAAEKAFPNGIHLSDLWILGAESNGYRHYGRDITMDMQRAAFQPANNRMVKAGGFSTLSIPNILAATANKFLLRGFMSVDQTWSRISKRRSVPDFKAVNTYTLTGGMTYDKIGASGELKHGTVGEESYSNQAETYGKMFAITRRDLINDDLDALSEVPMRLGRGAANKLNSVFWTVFLDNSAFFTSGNSNVGVGAGYALSAAGLAAGEIVFMNQTDPDGLPLGINPAILLVPTTLKTTAMTLMNSQYLIDGTATATQGSSNVFQGRFRVESSPYMENTSYTGYDTVAWYLLADPMDMAVIEVAFLNGRESPVVETAEASFNVLGVEMRGYHDFGVALQEPRGGVRNDTA